jgi:hypothetical protein
MSRRAPGCGEAPENTENLLRLAVARPLRLEAGASVAMNWGRNLNGTSVSAPVPHSKMFNLGGKSIGPGELFIGGDRHRP